MNNCCAIAWIRMRSAIFIVCQGNSPAVKATNQTRGISSEVIADMIKPISAPCSDPFRSKNPLIILFDPEGVDMFNVWGLATPKVRRWGLHLFFKYLLTLRMLITLTGIEIMGSDAIYICPYPNFVKNQGLSPGMFYIGATHQIRRNTSHPPQRRLIL